MLHAFSEQKSITFLIVLMLVLSILLQIIIGLLYQNMINETENMSATNHKLLKQCKLKFANCYRMNMGVPNIPVFVDKFLNRLSIGKCSFRTLYHLSGQFILLSVFFAGVGACKGIIGGQSFGEILPFYIVSLFGLYLFFSISSVIDIKGKTNTLKINLIDYLENHMVCRLSMPDMEDYIVKGPKEEKELVYTMQEEAKISSRQRRKETAFSQNEEQELEELLREFLV